MKFKIIHSIDGERVTINPFEFVRSVKVPPGKHTVRISWSVTEGEYYRFCISSDMWFVSEPGEIYYVNYKRKRNSTRSSVAFWLEGEDGKKIGGIKGSLDEPIK